MPYKQIDDLPESVKEHLPKHAQEQRSQSETWLSSQSAQTPKIAVDTANPVPVLDPRLDAHLS